MNPTMAMLAKGAVSVVVVVGVAVAAIDALMSMSPDAGPRAGHGAGADGSTTASRGATNGAQTPGGQAPDGQGNVSGGQAAGAGGAQTPGQPAPPQAVVAAAPPRKGNDFSAVDEPWRHALNAGTDPAAGQAIANGGKVSAGLAGCSSCHGAQGIPAAGAAFPALAGSSPAYLAKQLLDYRNGSRRNVIMESIAKGLDEAEIGSLAHYYGALPAPALPTLAAAAAPGAVGSTPMPGTPPSTRSPSSASPPTVTPTAGASATPSTLTGAARGQQLHDFGDNALALAACANCHGTRGAGEAPLLPRLAGQPPAYFISQMEAFRNGSRANDDVGTMRAIAKRLTPADTQALAQYYAGGH